MAANLPQMLDDAMALEAGGDLQGALDIWYLLEGQMPMTSFSKDGVQMTFSATSAAEKIAQLRRRIAAASGSGKYKRVPVDRIPTPDPALGGGGYYSDGYLWGY